MKYIRIAFRNLNRQKKRSILLGGAIGFGIMIITLVNGFTAGAVSNVKENFSYLLAGHIYLSEEIKREDGEVLELFEDEAPVVQVLNDLKIPESRVIRRSGFFGDIIFNGRSAGQNVIGVNWQAEPSLGDRMKLVLGSVNEAQADPRGIIISEQVADRLDLQIGDDVTVRMETVTGQQNVGTMVIRAIMADPGILGSISAYANIDLVNSLLNIPENSFQSLNITLGSLEEVDLMTARIYEELGKAVQVAERGEQGGFSLDDISFTYQDEPEPEWTGTRYKVQNINDFTSQIDQLSATLNGVGLGILLVLILITMVGVANTFRMIMYERVKEIGTMRAIGMQRGGVRKIFIYEAFALGTFGYFAGVVLALIVSFFLGFIQIPNDNAFSLFTMNGSLTFPMQAGSMIFNFILIAGLTVLAAAFPANKAAKLQPADALRA
jgi:putative ABC transport system permease protein